MDTPLRELKLRLCAAALDMLAGLDSAPVAESRPAGGAPCTCPADEVRVPVSVPEPALAASGRFLLNAVEAAAVRCLKEVGEASGKVIAGRTRLRFPDGRPNTHLRDALPNLVLRGILVKVEGGYRIADDFAPFVDAALAAAPAPKAKKLAKPDSVPAAAFPRPATVHQNGTEPRKLSGSELAGAVLSALREVGMPLGMVAVEVALRERGARARTSPTCAPPWKIWMRTGGSSSSEGRTAAVTRRSPRPPR